MQRLMLPVNYRHVVFTVPEQLRHYFQKYPYLLSEMVVAAKETLEEVISQAARKKVSIGAVAVIQTAGRASNYNPHTHIMSTSGGIDATGKWVEVNNVSYEYLHKEWQRRLFSMLEERVGGQSIKTLLESLRQKYSKGIVAYWDGRAVKAGKGLAKYLIKYVASPPIAVSRIIEYDGESVEYVWQDHKSNQQESAKVSAVEFIHRLVQHILPKGFQRVRYLGLHAVCLRKKVIEKLRLALGAVMQIAFYFGQTIMKKLGWRAKIKEKFHRDPMKCDKCGEEMLLWRIFAPLYGNVFYYPDDEPDFRPQKPTVKEQEKAQMSFVF